MTLSFEGIVLNSIMPCIADDAIEVHVSPQLLNASKRGWVTVNWTNVPNPSNDDWIGLWSLSSFSSIDPKLHAPVKFKVVDEYFSL